MPLSTMDLERQRLLRDPWSSFSNNSYVTRTAPPPVHPAHVFTRQNSGLSQVRRPESIKHIYFPKNNLMEKFCYRFQPSTESFKYNWT